MSHVASSRFEGVSFVPDNLCVGVVIGPWLGNRRVVWVCPLPMLTLKIVQRRAATR